MFGVFICRYWNGADEKFATTSFGPPTIAAVASRLAIDSVIGSRAWNLSAPSRFAAAICRMIACIDTFTAGSAILCSGLKSLSDLIEGSRTISISGDTLKPVDALTSIGVPLVFDQMVM